MRLTKDFSVAMDVGLILQFSRVFDVPIHVTHAVRILHRSTFHTQSLTAFPQSRVLPHVGAQRRHRVTDP